MVVIIRQCDISIHALREEGDPETYRYVAGYVTFLSTPSARRATTAPCRHSVRSGYFYPRPPRGGRQSVQTLMYPDVQFLSTPSARRATFKDFRKTETIPYFYPRPPRGGRLSLFYGLFANVSISIHALREEGDLAFLRAVRQC